MEEIVLLDEEKHPSSETIIMATLTTLSPPLLTQLIHHLSAVFHHHNRRVSAVVSSPTLFSLTLHHLHSLSLPNKSQLISQHLLSHLSLLANHIHQQQQQQKNAVSDTLNDLYHPNHRVSCKSQMTKQQQGMVSDTLTDLHHPDHRVSFKSQITKKQQPLKGVVPDTLTDLHQPDHRVSCKSQISKQQPPKGVVSDTLTDLYHPDHRVSCKSQISKQQQSNTLTDDLHHHQCHETSCRKQITRQEEQDSKGVIPDSPTDLHHPDHIVSCKSQITTQQPTTLTDLHHQYLEPSCKKQIARQQHSPRLLPPPRSTAVMKLRDLDAVLLLLLLCDLHHHDPEALDAPPSRWRVALCRHAATNALKLSNYLGISNSGVLMNYIELISKCMNFENATAGGGGKEGREVAAAAATVVALPSVEVGGPGWECVICKEEMSEGREVCELPCLHLFHWICILPWLKKRNTCPCCRYSLPTDDVSGEIRRLWAVFATLGGYR